MSELKKIFVREQFILCALSYGLTNTPLLIPPDLSGGKEGVCNFLSHQNIN